MKVVLRDDVAGVGRRGDIVKVAGGFARNFLLPEGRAIVATEGVEGQAQQMRRGRDQREAQDRGAAESQATVLAGAVIPINARASGGGRLFGSIGPADVADAIKAAKGIEVDRKHILLPEHIKETGSFEVTVELLPRRRHHRDGGGLASLLTRARGARWSEQHPPVCHSLCPSWGRANLRFRWSTVRDHSCTAYPHARPAYPHLLGPYVPQTPTGRVGEPWSKPLTTSAPVRFGRPLPPCRAARGCRPTTWRRRSRCSGRCSSPTTRRRSG